MHRNTYGEVGLLDMPGAHMAEDGNLSFSVGDVGSAQRYNLTFQALPWLEATFRYVHLDPAPEDYQRNLSFRMRLVQESDYLPDIAIGIRDLIGSNAYAAEYIVASKHFGDFDLTAGMGWGRLAGTNTLLNPLGFVSSAFKSRIPSNNSNGGTVGTGKFFRGKRVGIFGGGSWHTPIDGLNVVLEYSTDKYRREGRSGGVKVRSPINVGLSYQPYSALAITAGWFYGSTYGFVINLNGDTKSAPTTAQRLSPPVPQPKIRNYALRQDALEKLVSRGQWDFSQYVQTSQTSTQSADLRERQAITAALFSVGNNPRDVDAKGNTLIVDARSNGDANAQCAAYARIASASSSHYTAIALSDLNSSNNRVTFCNIPIKANLVVGHDAANSNSEYTNTGEFKKRLVDDLGKQDLILEAVSTSNSELWLYYQNGRYRTEAEAIGRVVRVLMAAAPPSIEIFHIVSVNLGQPDKNVTVVRSAIERKIIAKSFDILADRTVTIKSAPLDNPALDGPTLISYPRFSWALDPQLSQHFFDPSKPLQFDLKANLRAGVAITRHLNLGAVVTANIWNNLKHDRPSDSLLPHVRTDLQRYLKDGKNGISFFGATYYTRLDKDVFAEIKAGYLEDMYMGVGGQVLWRPEGSRFAFGVDVYQVWKRDYNRLFGIQDYQVLTGHASLYYQSPWYGLNFKLHAGRYLAGDYGATFEVSRRLSTGVEVGFFASFTNVPFRKFGEGSFDKGIFLHIPFDWGLPIASQSSYDLHLRSLTRDGGQRLLGDDSLYRDTERTSYGSIFEHADQIVAP